MSTARDLITRSLRLIHVLDPGEVPTADEATDSLEALNDMIDLMSIPGLYIYATRQDDVTWPGSTESRTIGSGGDFNITRPTRVEDSTFFTSGSSDDYPLVILRDRASYSGIIDKDTTSDLPEVLYYEPLHPLGTLYIWPVPADSLTIHLHTQEQLDQFASLDTAFAYPPGYREFLLTQLCLRLAPEFGVAVPPETAQMASKAEKMVKRMNAKHRNAYLEVSVLGAGPTYSVYSDT